MNKQSQIAGMKGFSLIELMIGITLGLLIMTALVTLFVNTSRTNTEMAKVNSQIENGRFAMQLMANEIVHAGFWGGYVPDFDNLTAPTQVKPAVPPLTVPPSTTPTAIPDPCLAIASVWDNNYKNAIIGIPVQVYETNSPMPVCDSVVTAPKAGTDVLIARHAATTPSNASECDASGDNNICFQASNCATEITAGNHYVLGRYDDIGGFPLNNLGCSSVAIKRKLVSNIYWIRNDNTLMRSDLTDAGYTTQPLIDGIEGLSIELGIDNISDHGINILTGTPPIDGQAASLFQYTSAIYWEDDDNLTSPTNRGDGSPDSYTRCTTLSPCSLAQLTNTISVKLYVLARADVATPGYTDTKVYNLGTTTLGPFNDNFKRHVFSTTVRLNNVSSRRETP